MVGAVDVSVLASAVLATAWIRGASRQSARDAESSAPGTTSLTPQEVAWALIMGVRSLNQVLPVAFVMLAAASPVAVILSACSFGLPDEKATGWLGDDPDIGALRRWAIMAALAVWRAEKLESLLQRIQRSAGVIAVTGFGQCLKSGLADPGIWFWPGFWGSVRRFALVAIASFGHAPFVRIALPAVVLDEFLWWALSKTQDLWTRKVCSLPTAVDLLVLPILDLLHFLPVVTKVFLLGIMEYPAYDSPGAYPLTLVVCALAWTAHNCHTLHSTVFVDLPEIARQLWAARNMGT